MEPYKKFYRSKKPLPPYTFDSSNFSINFKWTVKIASLIFTLLGKSGLEWRMNCMAT